MSGRNSQRKGRKAVWLQWLEQRLWWSLSCWLAFEGPPWYSASGGRAELSRGCWPGTLPCDGRQEGGPNDDPASDGSAARWDADRQISADVFHGNAGATMAGRRRAESGPASAPGGCITLPTSEFSVS